MTLNPPFFSSYAQSSLQPSPVNQLMADFASDFRDDIDINLGVGYVNEDTIPHQRIQEALDVILSQPEKYRVPFNYGGPAGSPNLIASLRDFYLRNSIGGLTEEILGKKEIRIGSNGTSGILEAVADIIEPGIVITSDPMYYIYCDFLERKGFQLIAVPEDENGVCVDLLEEKLDALGGKRDQLRFFYFVTVNNPTSSILSNERRRKIVELASSTCRKLNREIPLLFDGAYERLIHDPSVEKLESGFLNDELGIVYELGTFSKIFAPALRVGYLLGPAGPLVDLITQKTSDSGFSAPLITQEITGYLLDKHIEAQAAEVNQGYRQKAEEIKSAISSQLGPFLDSSFGGRAAFYFYLTFKDILTEQGSAFFSFLSRNTGVESLDGPRGSRNPRVVYIPGEFFVHPRGDLVEKGRKQLRISYGFEEVERVVEAIGHMREAAEYSRSAGL